MSRHSRLHLNCDCGERGAAHPEDSALLPLVDCINIACGGHAGDKHSATHLYKSARDQGVDCSLHLSYPDREHFGRRSLSLDEATLRAALDAQRQLLPTLTTVKFHGALYNDATRDRELAELLAQWLLDVDIALLLCPPDSALHRAAAGRGISCLREGFADRVYEMSDGSLHLRDRQLAGAVYHEPARILAQVASVQETGVLPLGTAGTDTAPFSCDTWCVHSDSPGAIAAITTLREWQRSCS